MTEYDYSPDAYERYMATQARISNWVSEANQHSREFCDPIHERPHPRKSSFYSQTSSSGSEESVYRSQHTTRSFASPNAHSRPDYHRSRSSKSRKASRPPSPTGTSSSSSSSSSFSVINHAPIDPYKYYSQIPHQAPHSYQKPPSFPVNQTLRPQQQPRSHTTFAPQGIQVHAPTPIRAPYGTAQGSDSYFPSVQKHVILDGKRTDYVNSPHGHAYPKPHSSRPPIYSQPSAPYGTPPALVSPVYSFQSGPPTYFTHPPPARTQHYHHHPTPPPQRPLFKRVIGSFQKHSDTGRRHSRRDY